MSAQMPPELGNQSTLSTHLYLELELGKRTCIDYIGTG